MEFPGRRFRRWVFCAVCLMFLPFSLVGAEDVLFRLDGSLGKDGRAQVVVPLVEGQQVLFRLASLDAPLRLRVYFAGQELVADPETAILTSGYVHTRKPGLAQVTIESAFNSVVALGSFQLRVVRMKDTASLVRTGVLKGNITRDDQREGKNRFVDWYPLAVTKGQRLLVGMASRSVDTVLRLELPDGSGLENDDAIGTDSRLVVEVGESGIAWVGAGAIIRDDLLRDDLNLAYQVYVRDFPAQPKPLIVGQIIPPTPFIAVAEDVSPLPEQFTFVAAKPGVYRFRLDGRDGAIPVLQATLETGRRFLDSAYRSGRDFAQIRCYLRQNQRLDLVAESLPGGVHQHFGLSNLYEGSGVILKDGDNLERNLTDVRQGYYVYRGKAGEFVQFLMTSDDFETRLVASDVLGQVFTWSKYYGSDFSYASLGAYWFDQAGELLLETAGKNNGDEGVYQLTAISSLSNQLDLPRDPSTRSVLTASTPLFYRLTDRSIPLADGYCNEFFMDLKAMDLISLRLQSNDVETGLIVFNTDGSELARSGELGGKDHTLELVAPRTGRYLVRSLVPSGEGAALNATATINFDVLGTAAAVNSDLVNRSFELNLVADRPAGELPYQELNLRLRQNQHLYAVVDSGDFQPVLKLLDKDGVVVEENNGFGMKGRSRVDLTIQKGGSYRLRVIKPGAPPALTVFQPDNPGFTVSVYEIR